MELISPSFLLLLFLLPPCYWALPFRYRPYLLLAGSYLFYSLWDLRFLPVLLASTLLDYAMGLQIGKSGSQRKKQLLLTVSVAANLLILGTFKYANFFLSTAAGAWSLIGREPGFDALTLFVPLGVSFYTFHSISYVVDVYRGRYAPIHSFSLYALYVTFFPKLISGPIERTESFLPQLTEERKLNGGLIVQASGLLAFGYFLKLCVGDRMAGVADLVFHEPLSHSLLDRWLGLYAFSFEIYADFLGYTLIAQGSALLFALRLSENFRRPYLAANPQEFWRRWHITLSSWFRDYVYIPLGGGRRKMARNILITMALAGLWHGASGHFIAWGIYHGLLLAGYRAVSWPRFPKAVGVFVTFHLVTLGWVFFRASSLAHALEFLGGLFSLNAPLPDLSGLPSLFLLLLAVWLLGFALFLAYRKFSAAGDGASLSWRSIGCGLPLGAFLFLIVFLGAENAKPFIYFQF